MNGDLEFYIVNDVDRPCPEHVAQRRGDRIHYIHRDLRDREAYSEGFPLDRATPLGDFGIEVVADGPSGIAKFVLRRNCTATYADGRPRKWQGRTMFHLELLGSDMGEGWSLKGEASAESILDILESGGSEVLDRVAAEGFLAENRTELSERANRWLAESAAEWLKEEMDLSGYLEGLDDGGPQEDRSEWFDDPDAAALAELNELGVPEDELEENGGRFSQDFEGGWGDWMKENDPVAFRVHVNERVREETGSL